MLAYASCGQPANIMTFFFLGNSMKPPPDRGSVKKKLKPAVPLGRLVRSQLLPPSLSLSPNAPHPVSTWHLVLEGPAGESELPPRKPLLLRVLPRPRPRPPLNNPRNSSRLLAKPADTCLLTCVRAPVLPLQLPRTVLHHRALPRNPHPGHKHLRPLRSRSQRPRNGRPGGDSNSKS